MATIMETPSATSEPELKDAVSSLSSVDSVEVDSVEETGPDYVGIYSSTIFAVSVLFLLGVGVPCAIYLDNWLSGMALGAFCAAWGGPSFGVMAASARISAWFEAHEEH